MKRKFVQIICLLLSNSYLAGFSKGNIYRGRLKQFCVPGLNCYSCPGAVGSCPLGALQAVLSSVQYSFSFYVGGILLLFGVSLGRFVCGFLCPFGLLQELVHKIPGPKIKLTRSWPLYIKYVLLAVFVIGLPLLAVNQFGLGQPYFCKYICPSGTLTAGLPLLALNPNLREAIGALFALKATVAALIIGGCFIVYRFFCRCLCPLGAIYALLNKVSFYKLTVNPHKCLNCGACAKICPMQVNPCVKPNSPECIRCGICAKNCPAKAMNLGFKQKIEDII